MYSYKSNFLNRYLYIACFLAFSANSAPIVKITPSLTDINLSIKGQYNVTFNIKNTSGDTLTISNLKQEFNNSKLYSAQIKNKFYYIV